MAAARSIVALLLMCTAVVLGARYQVTMSASLSAAITKDGASVFSGAPTIAGSVYTYGTYALNVPAAASTQTALAAAFPTSLTGTLNCASVIQVASLVQSCVEAMSAPDVTTYLGDTTAALRCATNAPSSSVAFDCSSSGGLTTAVTFDAATYSTASAVLAFTTDASVSTTLEAQAVILAIQRTQGLVRLAQANAAVARANNDRAKETRVVAAFIYLFVAIGMSALAGILAFWSGWLHPIFGRYSESVYFCIWFVVIHGASWAGGLTGWIAILSIVAVALLLFPIIYGCIRFFHGRSVARLAAMGDLPSAETTADDTTGTVSDSDQQESDGSASVERTDDDADADADADDSDAADPAPKETVGEPRAFGFSKQPSKLGRKQAWGLAIAFLILFAATVICIVLFFAWGIDKYYIWDRSNQVVVDEFQPKTVAKVIGLLYGFDRWASILRVDWLLQAQTKGCGVYFKRTLKSDAEKRAAIHDAFIDEYNIDMSIFERTRYQDYTSVNDWFTRKLATGARPTAYASNPLVVTSVADCRLVVYPSIDADLHIWLKDQAFSVKSLLNYDSVAAPFQHGAIAIFRLAPADYHLSHSPLSGSIVDQYFVKSTIYSVGADAMRSNNGAIYNTRMVSIIQDKTVAQRKVAFVAIGATCVGSVFMTKGNGADVVKGEQIEGFAFGGSTIVVVFPAGTVKFDSDLVENSRNGVETLVTVGSKVGVWTV